MEHLNCIQIAVILGDEDIALDVLNFVAETTEAIDAKKLLFEFMGRIWGNGNTTLHLASFQGMSCLVKRMIQLGATTSKMNERHFKAVDCAFDDETIDVFKNSDQPELHIPIVEKDDVSLTPISIHGRSQSVDLIINAKMAVATDIIRKSRAATATSLVGRSAFQSKFPVSDESIGNTKAKKSVQFDSHTMIFQICQNPDSVNDPIGFLRTNLRTGEDSQGIDINKMFTPHQYLTPLHLACTHGNLEITTLLLTEAGSRVNTRDIEGWCPIHCASAEGHVEVIKLLGRCQGNSDQADGSKPHAEWIYVPDGPIDILPENEEGDTPAQVALDEQKVVICDILNALTLKYPALPKTEQIFNEFEEDEELELLDSAELPIVSHPTVSRLPERHHGKAPKPAIIDINLVKAVQPASATIGITLGQPPCVEPCAKQLDRNLPEIAADSKSTIPPVYETVTDKAANSSHVSQSTLHISTAVETPSAAVVSKLSAACDISSLSPSRGSPRKISVSRPRNSYIPAAMGETSAGDFSWMKDGDLRLRPNNNGKRQSKLIESQRAVEVQSLIQKDSPEELKRGKSVKDRIKSFETNSSALQKGNWKPAK